MARLEGQQAAAVVSVPPRPTAAPDPPPVSSGAEAGPREPLDLRHSAEPWTAKITPSRLGYWIGFHKGVMEELGTTFAWRRTRKGAERYARRGIANRNANDARLDAAWVVR
jgi:hypothetical protein